ncbi:hypothetical protein Zmor_016045 [Zophobas morio]|uniref:Uncharacterized protein n=1 Tax=Zophobas morio TaxID=2755281 RepID=A0AA38MI81_9CUCU|nr:hypothetical protein Zmor_016045 [Zophobas morio]
MVEKRLFVTHTPFNLSLLSGPERQIKVTCRALRQHGGRYFHRGEVIYLQETKNTYKTPFLILPTAPLSALPRAEIYAASKINIDFEITAKPGAVLV